MTVYLDHAATTPLRPEAREAWLAASAQTGNASSIHRAGQNAKRMLAEARERLAAVLDCDAVEVVFTSGGTESINTALKGLWWARPAGAGRIALPDGEHHATLEVADWLHRQEGADVTAVPLDHVGRILPDAFAAALAGPAAAPAGSRPAAPVRGGSPAAAPSGPRSAAAVATALVANNEVGTINDAAALAQTAAAARVPLHLDAVAAFGHVPMSFRQWRADAAGPVGLVALSVSAHKIGGPVGVGALVVSRAATPTPLLQGGGQQRGLRPGTQDVAGACAFAVAAELAAAERAAEAVRLVALRDRLVRGIHATVPDATLLGDPTDRLPGNAHVLFAGALGETLLFVLDRADVCASTGSACQAGIPEPSHVVAAMGRTDAEARQVLRFTLGRTSTDADVDEVLAALPAAVARARAAAPR
ncbi:cysteine desulfurase family protein [Microbacterium kribbense]|uniref:Cysteine desulfurase family protein n=1 Tax=Microbacterium kribbense TaxID=433645 RepID=A0ABP7GPX1_9MICO